MPLSATEIVILVLMKIFNTPRNCCCLLHLYLVSIFIEFLMRTPHIANAMAKEQAM